MILFKVFGAVAIMLGGAGIWLELSKEVGALFVIGGAFFFAHYLIDILRQRKSPE